MNPGNPTSAYSYAKVVYALTVLSAPDNFARTADIGAVTLKWDAPFDGGSPITGYCVAYDDNDGRSGSEILDADASTYSFTDLKLDKLYKFTVYAISAVGNGVVVTINTKSLAVKITSSVLPKATLGVPCTATIEAEGATPITWSVEAGNMLPGLTLDANTGVISGIPGKPKGYTSSSVTSNTVVYKATNPSGSVTKSVIIILEKSYTITFDVNGGGTVTPGSSICYCGGR